MIFTERKFRSKVKFEAVVNRLLLIIIVMVLCCKHEDKRCELKKRKEEEIRVSEPGERARTWPPRALISVRHPSASNLSS